MSPTMTDDALVRELRVRTESAVPRMELNPDALLAAGRRYRRRRTTVRLATGAGGAAALALVALGAAELAHSMLDSDVTAAARLVEIGDFTVIAATAAVPVEPEAEPRIGTEDTTGSLYDTGIPVDPNDPGGARWVLEHVVLETSMVDVELVLEGAPDHGTVAVDPQPLALASAQFLVARSWDPATGELGERPIGAYADRTEELYWTGGMNWEVDGTQLVWGLAEYGYTPHLYVTSPAIDVPAVQSRVLVPTIRIPGVDGPVYFAQVSGDQTWPSITLYPAQYASLRVTG
jgi:hypothetical protein